MHDSTAKSKVTQACIILHKHTQGLMKLSRHRIIQSQCSACNQTMLRNARQIWDVLTRKSVGREPFDPLEPLDLLDPVGEPGLRLGVPGMLLLCIIARGPVCTCSLPGSCCGCI